MAGRRHADLSVQHCQIMWINKNKNEHLRMNILARSFFDCEFLLHIFCSKIKIFGLGVGDFFHRFNYFFHDIIIHTIM